MVCTQKQGKQSQHTGTELTLSFTFQSAESPQSPVPILQIYYTMTKIDRNMQPVANCSITQKSLGILQSTSTWTSPLVLITSSQQSCSAHVQVNIPFATLRISSISLQRKTWFQIGVYACSKNNRSPMFIQDVSLHGDWFVMCYEYNQNYLVQFSYLRP